MARPRHGTRRSAPGGLSRPNLARSRARVSCPLDCERVAVRIIEPGDLVAAGARGGPPLVGRQLLSARSSLRRGRRAGVGRRLLPHTPDPVGALADDDYEPPLPACNQLFRLPARDTRSGRSTRALSPPATTTATAEVSGRALTRSPCSSHSSIPPVCTAPVCALAHVEGSSERTQERAPPVREVAAWPGEHVASLPHGMDSGPARAVDSKPRAAWQSAMGPARFS